MSDVTTDTATINSGTDQQAGTAPVDVVASAQARVRLAEVNQKAPFDPSDVAAVLAGFAPYNDAVAAADAAFVPFHNALEAFNAAVAPVNAAMKAIALFRAAVEAAKADPFVTAVAIAQADTAPVVTVVEDAKAAEELTKNLGL